MTKKKKIIVIIGSLDVGGAEMDIVRNYPIINKTHDVTILLYSHPGKLADQITKAGVKVVALKSPTNIIGRIAYKTKGLSFFAMLANCFLFLRSHIKSEQADIIHAFLPLSYIYATFIKFTLPKPKPLLIMSRLSLNFYFAKHKIAAFLETKVCHKYVDRAVGNTKAILNDLKKEGIPEEKLFLLYNGIEVDRFQLKRSLEDFKSAKILQMIAVGNLFTYKGHGDLLNALSILKIKRPDLTWHLNIIGRNEEDNLERYQTFLKQHNMQENVSFVGASNDVFSFLKNSHLHIHPSHTEGLPNSIIEAMSSSISCIATEVGGIPELIDHNKTGLIVPPKSPNALSKAIEKMLSDREKLYNYGRAAEKKAKTTFGVKQSVARYLKLYN
ncbi:MAG: glycosyltransferase [Rickettsiaceae bacterium]|nr:glycosyltransferase [Rickettsiaceae bacterium]